MPTILYINTVSPRIPTWPSSHRVAYRRRHPEQTALYQVVQQHLESYFALAREDDCDGQRVPAYVEREFRRNLECGVLA